MRTALTIAGSDPSGGAGIQADLKTFSALKVYGMAALTALTAQNTQGVTGVSLVPAKFVRQQIDTVLADITPDAVKTGMLGDADTIAVVADRAREHGFKNLVVDPVMVAKSGDRLLREDAVTTLKEHLLPEAYVVTPNLPEAETLLDRRVDSLNAMEQAARQIHELGSANVVVKGGHLAGDTVTDVLFDGQRVHKYASARVATRNTHGTGCTFASAIAAYLARGETVPDAVMKAKQYLVGALQHAYDVGHGHGPVHHFWQAWNSEDRGS